MGRWTSLRDWDLAVMQDPNVFPVNLQQSRASWSHDTKTGDAALSRPIGVAVVPSG